MSTYIENTTAWLGETVVEKGASAKNNFALSSAYSSYELSTSENNLILSKKSTPTPSPSYSSSSRQTGYTQILQEVPTTTPTPNPTDKPVETSTILPTAKPTTQPTQSSPAPVVGIIAGLGVAALVLGRMRR